MWDSCNGVNINSGFGSEGAVNLGFWAEDCRIVVYEEFFGVYSMVEKGKESSEFCERHCRNLSWTGSESSNEGCKNRKTKSNRMEKPEQAILLLFFPAA